MRKKRATQKDVDDFLEAVFPGYEELAVWAFDEGDILRTATEIINEMRPLVRALSEMWSYELYECPWCLADIDEPETTIHTPSCPISKAKEMVKSWD